MTFIALKDDQQHLVSAKARCIYGIKLPNLFNGCDCQDWLIVLEKAMVLKWINNVPLTVFCMLLPTKAQIPHLW